MIAPAELYPTGRTNIWVVIDRVVIDLRDRIALKGMRRLRGCLREFGELEFIDEDHAVLIAWRGGARRLVA
jgi:hypothetical protein